MPLLAFLAFYQVLEYHFPAYSPSKQVDALRDKLREIAGDVKEGVRRGRCARRHRDQEKAPAA
jgi:hypothetical protein